MNVVDEPIITTGAASAGLMNAELGRSVQSSGRERGHELKVGGLAAKTSAEGSEGGPASGAGLY